MSIQDIEESIFDYNAISEFYSSVLRPILPKAKHKSVGYFGPPTTKAQQVAISLADTNEINRGSQYFYTGVYKFIHYTSIQNAINIIRSKKIRLYNLDGMDDKEEFVIPTKYLDLKLSDYQIRELKQNIFCLSMCEETVEKSERSLSMWRQYAQDGNGVGLVFSFNKNEASSWVHYMLSQVHYSEKRLQIFKEVAQLYQIFKAKWQMSITEFDRMFYKYYSFHKNKIYTDEREVRLLYNTGFDRYDRATVEFDVNRNGEMTSYIELPIEWAWPAEKRAFHKSQGYKLPNVVPIVKLEKIVFGYRLDNKVKWNTCDVLRELFKKYKHSPTMIESTLTPSFNSHYET